MSLRLSYTLLAPFYDLVAGAAFAGARRASLSALPSSGHGPVLVNGVGTGLDLPFSDEPAVAGGWFRRIRLERL